MLLKCDNCGYVWDYGGDKKHHATCPDCLRKVKVEEYKKNESES